MPPQLAVRRAEHKTHDRQFVDRHHCWLLARRCHQDLPRDVLQQPGRRCWKESKTVAIVIPQIETAAIQSNRPHHSVAFAECARSNRRAIKHHLLDRFQVGEAGQIEVAMLATSIPCSFLRLSDYGQALNNNRNVRRYPSETPVSRSILIRKMITSGTHPSTAMADSTGVNIGKCFKSLLRICARSSGFLISSNVPKAIALRQCKSL